MHSQFIARNSEADCSAETQGVLENKSYAQRTKRFDKTKWS